MTEKTLEEFKERALEVIEELRGIKKAREGHLRLSTLESSLDGDDVEYSAVYTEDKTDDGMVSKVYEAKGKLITLGAIYHARIHNENDMYIVGLRKSISEDSFSVDIIHGPGHKEVRHEFPCDRPMRIDDTTYRVFENTVKHMFDYLRIVAELEAPRD